MSRQVWVKGHYRKDGCPPDTTELVQMEIAKTTTAIRATTTRIQWSLLVAILWNTFNNVGERNALRSPFNLLNR